MSEEPLHKRFKPMAKCGHKNKTNRKYITSFLPQSVSKRNYGNGLNIFQSLPKVSKVLVKMQLTDCADFYAAPSHQQAYLSSLINRHFKDIKSNQKILTENTFSMSQCVIGTNLGHF